MFTAEAFAAAQGLLGARVLGRMLATSAGDPIVVTAELRPPVTLVAAVVPVLNERARLGACLEGLLAQGRGLVQIVVVDGGSTDGTQALTRRYAARDARVQLVDAAPVGAGWNGKAWGLAAGLAATDPEAAWILCLDADVRAQPHLVSSLLAHAAHAYCDAFSAAPLFELSDAHEAVVHPALLATLVYRYGLPGNVARTPRDAQANGQCFFARRDLLVRTRAFAAAKTSRCDDYTVARTLVAGGAQVGFFEGGRLARVAMYASSADCWTNWPRSLALCDATTSRVALAVAFAEIALVQALPLVLVAAVAAKRARTDTFFFRVNVILAIARLGVLWGTRRAYARVPFTYWLSPLADVPALVRIVGATFERAPTWRGRTLVSQRRPA
ncbi:MAG: glycosyltransferase [Candidatus Eremiobacteraeota bacterium]|nr:glycosyltransferase [Candidatus Eremiobacteraeota bacterium]